MDAYKRNLWVPLILIVIKETYMCVCEIRRLTDDYYSYYDREIFPELLTKVERSYDVIVFELEILKNCFIAVPFRTKMRHKNGYHFRFSKRSKQHQSGLDYSKIVIIHKTYLHFIGKPSIVDLDEYVELQKNRDKIHKNIEEYIVNYIKHVTGVTILDVNKFEREYRFSTLQYFHSELGIG